MIALIVLCISLRLTLASTKTELVLLLFRHGDRSPYNPYLGYPHESAWPQGFGQLSTIGMKQQFGVGSFIRERYVPNLLAPEYRQTEVYVRSTDFDRTIMSALTQLSGIFPPHDDQVWNPSLAWQPIPVHVVPISLDNVLMSGTNCPRYSELMKENRKSSKYIEMNMKYKYLFDSISKASNFPVSLDNIGGYIDTVVCDRHHNLSLPTWASENFDDLLLIQNWNASLSQNSREKILLSAGIFLSEFWARIDKKMDNSATVKACFYSAHDSTLITVLNAFGIWNGELPPYATLLITELIRDGEEWFVQFLYRNSSDGILHTLIVPTCDALCPVEKLRKLTADITTSKHEWEIKCGLKSENSYQLSLVLILQSTFFFLLITTLLVMIMTVVTCKKKKQQPYSVRYSKYTIDDTDDSDTAMDNES